MVCLPCNTTATIIISSRASNLGPRRLPAPFPNYPDSSKSPGTPLPRQPGFNPPQQEGRMHQLFWTTAAPGSQPNFSITPSVEQVLLQSITLPVVPNKHTFFAEPSLRHRPHKNYVSDWIPTPHLRQGWGSIAPFLSWARCCLQCSYTQLFPHGGKRPIISHLHWFWPFILEPGPAMGCEEEDNQDQR